MSRRRLLARARTGEDLLLQCGEQRLTALVDIIKPHSDAKSTLLSHSRMQHGCFRLKVFIAPTNVQAKFNLARRPHGQTSEHQQAQTPAAHVMRPGVEFNALNLDECADVQIRPGRSAAVVHAEEVSVQRKTAASKPKGGDRHTPWCDATCTALSLGFRLTTLDSGDPS